MDMDAELKKILDGAGPPPDRNDDRIEHWEAALGDAKEVVNHVYGDNSNPALRNALIMMLSMAFGQRPTPMPVWPGLLPTPHAVAVAPATCPKMGTVIINGAKKGHARYDAECFLVRKCECLDLAWNRWEDCVHVGMDHIIKERIARGGTVKSV